MEHITVLDKLKTLGFDSAESDWSELADIGRLTALRWRQDGSYFVSNWWRGPLLYALVSRFRPRNVLEFGTGRGYGAVTMAQASVDGGFNTTIWTIDTTPSWQPQSWHIDEGDGPVTQMLSIEEVWNRHFPADLVGRIRCIAGTSTGAMRGWSKRGNPQIDFIFIDADHTYWGVKHDFLAAVKVANPNALFVFDDYGIRPGYGVKRLVDEDIQAVSGNGSIEIVDMLNVSTNGTVNPGDDHRMAIWNSSDSSEMRERFRRQLLLDYPLSYGTLRLKQWARAIRGLALTRSL